MTLFTGFVFTPSYYPTRTSSRGLAERTPPLTSITLWPFPVPTIRFVATLVVTAIIVLRPQTHLLLSTDSSDHLHLTLCASVPLSHLFGLSRSISTGALARPVLASPSVHDISTLSLPFHHPLIRRPLARNVSCYSTSVLAQWLTKTRLACHQHRSLPSAPHVINKHQPPST